MCGIAGIFSLSGRQVLPDAIDCLTDSMIHRGPDGRGVWFSPDRSVALGHRRLSILDLSPAGAQPMVSHNGRHVICYNGEIYNFLEIRKELENSGHQFRTNCDTEVILHAWERWGTEMLRRFNGMWAFCIYDLQEGKLFLSRDRFGVKPLFYYIDKEVFIFASEVRAIHGLIPDRVHPDPHYLRNNNHFHISSHGGEDTHLKEVKSLMAGHNFEVSRERQRMSMWYEAEKQNVPEGYEEQTERFRELLIDACRLRLRSDVPVATCLSGGLDSSSIVSLLGRNRTESGARFSHFSHQSFTASFPGSVLDETADARHVADKAGMNFESHVIECPSPDELERSIEDCDGPMPALAFYPIWKLYGHIKQCGISVTIDGQGADEMLGGYYLGYPALRGAWQRHNPLMLMDMARTYSSIHPDAPKWLSADWQRWRMVAGLEVTQTIKSPLKKLLQRFGLYDISRMKMPLKPQSPPQIGKSFASLDELDIALWRQVFVAPLPFLFHQYDRCSMAHGVECRMPFMDYRLMEYVFSLPLSSRIGNGFTKRILRDSMRDILPERIRTNRMKTGFNAPFSDWAKGPLKEWYADQLNSQQFLENPCFDGLGIRNEFEKNHSNLDERTSWAALHYNYWMTQSRRFQPQPITG